MDPKPCFSSDEEAVNSQLISLFYKMRVLLEPTQKISLELPVPSPQGGGFRRKRGGGTGEDKCVNTEPVEISSELISVLSNYWKTKKDRSHLLNQENFSKLLMTIAISQQAHTHLLKDDPRVGEQKKIADLQAQMKEVRNKDGSPSVDWQQLVTIHKEHGRELYVNPDFHELFLVYNAPSTPEYSKRDKIVIKIDIHFDQDPQSEDKTLQYLFDYDETVGLRLGIDKSGQASMIIQRFDGEGGSFYDVYPIVKKSNGHLSIQYVDKDELKEDLQTKQYIATLMNAIRPFMTHMEKMQKIIKTWSPPPGGGAPKSGILKSVSKAVRERYKIPSNLKVSKVCEWMTHNYDKATLAKFARLKPTTYLTKTQLIHRLLMG